jgi:AcrR family transcriptional regulator
VTSSTRQRLIDGAYETLRTQGVAGASARVIAATAGVNQGLIFYHFGTVDALLAEACQAATAQRVEHYRARLAEVGTMRELLALGRTLHAEERELGNVTVLAQLLAGAQANANLADAARSALKLWTTEIEHALARLVATSPLGEVVDCAGLAHAVSAGFIGLELYEAADPDGAEAGFAALEQLGVLIEVVDQLGPVARRALNAKLRRA